MLASPHHRDNRLPEQSEPVARPAQIPPQRVAGGPYRAVPPVGAGPLGVDPRQEEHTAPAQAPAAPQAYPGPGAYPAPEAYQRSAPLETAPAAPAERSSRDRSLLLIILAVALAGVLVVSGVVFVAARVLDDGSTAPAGQPADAQSPGAPPTDIRLRDESTTITVSWTDPTAGMVPFVVAGGRAGLKLGALATVERGETSYTVNGLSPRVDYCFTVLAVYDTDSYATSGQACTNRSVTPSPR